MEADDTDPGMNLPGEFAEGVEGDVLAPCLGVVYAEGAMFKVGEWDEE